MNGYFEAISEQVVTVTLAGRIVSVDRARLGLHLRLGRLSDAFEEAPGSPEMVEAIQGYFEALGLDTGGASPIEILRAFAVLRDANAWQMDLAFMKATGKAREAPGGNGYAPHASEPYDYEGRNWAWVIHKIASRYGWTRDYIFNLYPEEAAAYLQEILIAEHFEAEERYRLSELAYQYDSATKTSRYVPYQKPAWMYSQELPKPVRVHKAALPFGVIDLSGKEVVYH